MSEPNNNVGSTSTINQRRSLIKYDKIEAELKNQSTTLKKLDKIEIFIKEKRSEKQVTNNSPTIFAQMTENQARVSGALELFNKYDVLEDDNIISEKEYAAYKMGKDPFEINKFDEEFLNSNAEEQFKKIIEGTFNEIGVGEQVSAAINELKDGDKIDAQTLVKDRYGVDLSQYTTEEEKLAAFQDAIKEKYSYDENDADSLYAYHKARLEAGDYTKEEKDLHGKLTPEQIEYYAKLATQRDALVEMTGYFAAADAEGQALLVKSIGILDENVQTGIIGAAILSANDKETRHQYATLIAGQDLKLSDRSQKLLKMATVALGSNLTVREMLDLVSNEENFATASAQTYMYKETDSVERAKVSAGLITQEQYDQNYSTVYAGTAYKLQEAAEAYQYVIDNANDNNRAGAMNTLASNAYKIEDSTQRNGAINNIKNSEHYSPEIMNTLDKAYVNSVSGNSKRDNSIKVVTNPLDANLLSNEFINKTNDIIQNGNEAEISRYIRDTMKDIDSPRGTTKQRHELTRQQGMYILSKLISQGKIQGSQYEGFVINKLSALPPQTLVNMYLSSNQKVQAYFDKNNLVSPLWIAMNAPASQIENLNETTKEKVLTLRGETDKIKK